MTANRKGTLSVKQFRESALREEQVALAIALVSKSGEPNERRAHEGFETALRVLDVDPDPTSRDVVTVSYSELRGLLQAVAQWRLAGDGPSPKEAA